MASASDIVDVMADPAARRAFDAVWNTHLGRVLQANPMQANSWASKRHDAASLCMDFFRQFSEFLPPLPCTLVL